MKTWSSIDSFVCRESAGASVIGPKQHGRPVFFFFACKITLVPGQQNSASCQQNVQPQQSNMSLFSIALYLHSVHHSLEGRGIGTDFSTHEYVAMQEYR